MKSDGAYKDAMDMLFENLGSLREVEAFFAWSSQHFRDVTQFNLDRYTPMSNLEFKTQLSQANWTGGNSALGLVNARLQPRNVDNVMEYIPLGRFKTHWLALRPSSRGLWAHRIEPCAYPYPVGVYVNPSHILGARYDVVNRDREKKRLLFAQFGWYHHVTVEVRIMKMTNFIHRKNPFDPH